jgi:hypothetical protein
MVVWDVFVFPFRWFDAAQETTVAGTQHSFYFESVSLVTITFRRSLDIPEISHTKHLRKI